MRTFLQKKLGSVGVEKIEIERSAGRITIIVYSSRPGLIIGRGGEGVERLRKELATKILKRDVAETDRNKKEQGGRPSSKTELRIEIREVKNPWLSASLSAQWIAQQLEKRLPYRRVLKQSLGKIAQNKEIKGVKIEVAGRLNGAEIARREWLKEGRLPLQTIRADIDYAQAEARCTYGVIGVKVWLYKGERFE